MGDLVLSVKGKWFAQVLSGEKTEEYRLIKPYWTKRLRHREYSNIIYTLGYPPKDDHTRRLVMPYKGYCRKTVECEEWNYLPIQVYAIKLEVPSND